MSADDKHDPNAEPDHTDSGRGEDIGAGYPESQPGGANPGPANQGAKGDTGEERPANKGGQDSDPAAATGNPGAAGG